MNKWFVLVAVMVCAVSFAQRGESQSARPQRGSGAVTVLRPHGFEPADLKLVAGNVRLIVHNRSSLDQISLRLRRATGEAVHEVTVPRGKGAWYGALNLPAGNYVLSETTRPRWICRITVNPAGN